MTTFRTASPKPPSALITESMMSGSLIHGVASCTWSTTSCFGSPANVMNHILDM